MNVPVILWDWNGTLLDDLDLCLSSINNLLQKRQIPLLDHDAYKNVFSFPVKNYYEAIGFDFTREHFDVPAKEFIDLYDSQVEECSLHDSAPEVLAFFKELGVRQFVLSAMKESMLLHTLKHNGILSVFEGVAGLKDHYATSKIERGHQLLRQFNIEKEKAWMIDDTDHDLEVATALGIHCLLIADGHQSKERLKKSGATVVENLKSLMDFRFF